MSTEFQTALQEACKPGPSRLLPGATVWGTNVSGTKQFHYTTGSRGIDDTRPLSDKDVFWVASMTKVCTGLAAVRCIEDGLLKLDDEVEVARLLPEFGPTPDLIKSFDAETGQVDVGKASRCFTVRELLTHTSGHAYDIGSPALQALHQKDGDAIRWMCGDLNKAFLTPLASEPGTSFEYSCCYDWLGRLIERAAGMTLEQYFQKFIFGPLGMKETTFDVDSRPDLASHLLPMTSRFRPDGPIENGMHPVCIRGPFIDCCGGMGLSGTASDWAKLMTAILRRDATLLAKPESWDLAFTGLSNAAGKKIMDRDMGGSNAAGWQAGMHTGLKWNWSPLGKVTESGLDGIYNPGTIFSFGAPNCIGVIDPKAGYTAFFFTQLLFGSDAPSEPLRRQFYEDVAQYFRE